MELKEDFLHFIWQLQYFNTPNLVTTTSEKITIIECGSINSNAGPDFSEVQLKIGDITWAGHVEMHIKASDWYRHNHQTDSAYDNVILHVVWENDREVTHRNGYPIPTLVLDGKVPSSLLGKYQQLLQNQSKLACSAKLKQVNRLTLLSMLDVALTNRLERKAREILIKLDENRGDWETTTYQVLCRNLGFKVNASPFEQLSQYLPLKILQKHLDQNLQVEALLFGVAGFLEGAFEDEYLKKMHVEFQFLQRKYSLSILNKSQWKLLRMRPANFPTIRLAQLAANIQSQRGFFSLILEEQKIEGFYKLFSKIPSEYWQNHYLPEKESARKINGLGKQSINNILINTVAPLLMAVGIKQQSEHFKQRAIRLLENLKPEENKYTKIWKEEGIKLQSAFDSQAGLELYQQYCANKKCLSCKIGTEILSK